MTDPLEKTVTTVRKPFFDGPVAKYNMIRSQSSAMTSCIPLGHDGLNCLENRR